MSLLTLIREVCADCDATEGGHEAKGYEITKEDEKSPWTPRRPPAVVKEIGGWPIPWRERWGRLSNQFEDEGVPFPGSERRAYHQVKAEMEAL